MKISEEEYNSLKQLDRIELNTNLLLLDRRFDIDLTFWLVLLLIYMVSFGLISIMIMLLSMNGNNLYNLQELNLLQFKLSGFFIIIIPIILLCFNIYYKIKAFKKIKQRFFK